MEFIYKVIDALVAMKGLKRTFATLGLLIFTVATIGALFILFRTYNVLGLAVLLFIFQILVPRDSILERIEMKKTQKQPELKTVQQPL